MTTAPNLAALMAEVDSSDKRLAEKQKAMEQAVRDYDDAELEHKTLVRALMLVKAPATEPAPAAQPQEEKPPLALCIEAIRATFIMPLREGVTDRMAQEQLAKAGHKFRLPTVRNALAKIGKESRAGSTGSPEPSDSPPVASSGAAGAGAFDHPERPAFLTRTRQAAE